MRFDLAPAARSDLQSVVAYYVHVDPALAARFAQRYEEALDQLELFPRSGSPVNGGVRRTFVRGFPWSLFYVVRDETGVVLRSLHDRRSPEEWPMRS